MAPEQALQIKAFRLDYRVDGDHYSRAISKLATGGGFAFEQPMTISRKIDTSFPVAY